MSVVVHERDQDEVTSPRPSKRAKLDEPVNSSESFLPPSISLLGLTVDPSEPRRLTEPLVGISEYIGHDVPKIHAIIKQRSVQIHQTICH
jgi:hypothetical protein